MVFDWVIGDGEFGPVVVGDVVTVGLALVAPEVVEPGSPAAATSDDDAHYVVDGMQITALTSDGRPLPTVVRWGDVAVALVGPVDGVGDGPVRLRGRLAVEPFHWAPGPLRTKFPEGVRPWRIVGLRTTTGTVITRIEGPAGGAVEPSCLVDLVPI